MQRPCGGSGCGLLQDWEGAERERGITVREKVRGVAAGWVRCGGSGGPYQDHMDNFLQSSQQPDKVAAVICLIFKFKK